MLHNDDQETRALSDSTPNIFGSRVCCQKMYISVVRLSQSIDFLCVAHAHAIGFPPWGLPGESCACWLEVTLLFHCECSTRSGWSNGVPEAELWLLSADGTRPNSLPQSYKQKLWAPTSKFLLSKASVLQSTYPRVISHSFLSLLAGYLSSSLGWNFCRLNLFC